MKISDVFKEMSLEVKTFKDGVQREVTGGYVSDLLSDVLAHAQEGNIWITLQTHQNIVAIASTKGLAGIIIVGGREPQQETLEKAESEKITILTSPLSAFEIAGKIYQLL
ncbi:MAG: serine kinase [Thermodesulfovibrionia bacterium]|nr:serine kinase [Thermodesulfovibrionia bacterium]